jgi:hypothetical protein
MLEASQDDISSNNAARDARRKHLIGRCIGAGVAAASIVAGLAASVHRSSSRVVSLVAATPPKIVTSPTFCPAVRAFVDNLPVIQVSLSDPNKLPALLNSAAAGVTVSLTAAPMAVQTDIATLTKAIGDFQAAMGAANNQLPKLSPKQAVSLQSPTVEQTISRLVNYVNTTCGPS